MKIVSFDDIEDVYDTIGIELMQLEDKEDYIAVYGKVDLIKERDYEYIKHFMMKRLVNLILHILTMMHFQLGI